MGLLALGFVATLICWREYEILSDAFDAVCDECSELRFRLTDAHDWLSDYDAMIDGLIAEREALAAELAERDRLHEAAFDRWGGELLVLIDERAALAADLAGTTDECRRLRLENDEMRSLLFVQGVPEFSGDKQAMSHRLYGRQSDVRARRGKRDRKREYR